jgi:hypothetical protein
MSEHGERIDGHSAPATPPAKGGYISHTGGSPTTVSPLAVSASSPRERLW